MRYIIILIAIIVTYQAVAKVADVTLENGNCGIYSVDLSMLDN